MNNTIIFKERVDSMNKKLRTFFILLVACTASAFAQSYVGVKGGGVNIGRLSWDDDAVMLGVVYGYDLPDNNFSFEGEFNTTVSKASSTNPSYGDLGITTLAGYAVFRTPGRFYLKAKLGLLYEYLTSSVSSSGGGLTIDVDGPGIAISYGVGGGVDITEQLGAEIEYTSIEADIAYASLGLNWKF